MEKHNNSGSSNGYEFNATSPQQILDNTASTINNSAYNEANSGDIYNNNNPFHASITAPEQQSNIHNRENGQQQQWREYRDDNNVIPAQLFTQQQSNIISTSSFNSGNLNGSGNNFDNMYEQQIPSSDFQEQQFNYAHHRGSLPIIHHHQRTTELFNPTMAAPPMDHMPATTTTAIINNTTPLNQQALYTRRHTEGSLPKYGSRKQRVSSSGSSNNSTSNSNSIKGEDEEYLNSEEGKRKHFLERNRQAALKCRQRKKQWLANLQHRVEFLSTDNEQLQSQATMLREEVINLKTLLLAHRDCKVAQANGTTMSMIQNVSSLPPQSSFDAAAAAAAAAAVDSVSMDHNSQQQPQ